MSDQDDKPSADLEALLRRWGAQTAMREANVPPAPSFDQEALEVQDDAAGSPEESPAGPPAAESQVGEQETSGETFEEAGVASAWPPPEAARPKIPLMLSRWLPVAVAAVLLLCSLILFVQAMAKSGTGGQELKDVIAERDQGRKDLQEAVSAVEAAKAELADQKRSYDDLTVEKTRAQRVWGEKEAELAKLRAAVALRARGLADMAPRLEAATADLEDARKLLAYKEKEAAKLVRVYDANCKQVVATEAELKRVIKVYEGAVEASRKVLNEMVVMHARREVLFADARRVYLFVKAPDEVGLHASQMAARRSAMIAQCPKLRDLTDADAMRTLLDKLEVFLTRLDLIDATSYEEVQSFGALVGTSMIIDEIDEALGMRIDDENLRTWLFQARLILMETERAD